QGRINDCVNKLSQAAAAPPSDSADDLLREMAREIVGRGSLNGPCNYVADDFRTIHAQIVTGPLLDRLANGIYSLIARIARQNNVSIETIATHFVQYQIVQRQVVELIRNAYTMLGEPQNLQKELEVTPNYLGELRDEEIAFLDATDVYILSQPGPPYDLSAASFADAIVQILEGTNRTLTTYSLSML